VEELHTRQVACRSSLKNVPIQKFRKSRLVQNVRSDRMGIRGQKCGRLKHVNEVHGQCAALVPEHLAFYRSCCLRCRHVQQRAGELTEDAHTGTDDRVGSLRVRRIRAARVCAFEDPSLSEPFFRHSSLFLDCRSRWSPVVADQGRRLLERCSPPRIARPPTMDRGRKTTAAGFIGAVGSEGQARTRIARHDFDTRFSPRLLELTGDGVLDVASSAQCLPGPAARATACATRGTAPRAWQGLADIDTAHRVTGCYSHERSRCV